MSLAPLSVFIIIYGVITLLFTNDKKLNCSLYLFKAGSMDVEIKSHGNTPYNTGYYKKKQDKSHIWGINKILCLKVAVDKTYCMFNLFLIMNLEATLQSGH